MAKKAQRLLTTDLFRKPLFWLLVVTLLGGAFRFYNLDWDFQHSFHPDERNILGQTAGIQPGTGYRVQFFAYGQLCVYLYRATGELVSSPQAWVNLLHGNAGWAQGTYWAFLGLLFGFIFWYFRQEKQKLTAFGISSFAFLLALFLKIDPNHYTRFEIFNSWFAALEPQRFSLGFLHEVPVLPIVCLVFVAAASFGISAILASFLEVEWVGIPFYSACGATLFLGALPGLLPEQFHLAKAATALAFTMLLLAGALWLAWVSRWGRVLLAVLAVWVYFATRVHGGNQYVGYGETMLIGRWWAGVFSTLTIGAVFLFVQRVYKNTSMALLAAASFAFAVVSIEQTHYCITESFITLMCVVVALSSAQIVQEKGSWRSYLLSGAAFGLAMAAKTSSLFYILIILVGHLVLLSQKSAKEWEKGDQKDKEGKNFRMVLTVGFLLVVLGGFLLVGIKAQAVLLDLFPQNQPQGRFFGEVFLMAAILIGLMFSVWGLFEFKALRGQMPQWVKLAASLALSFYLFCLLSPWSLLDYQGFMDSQNYEWHVVSYADACYVLQFKDTPRYLYQLWNLMSVELWWPLGITVILGMVWVAGRFLKNLATPARSGYLLPLPFARGRGFRFSYADLLLFAWFAAYFGFIGAWNTKFIRYMVPLIPAFCIFGAKFLTDILDWIRPRFSLGRFLKPLVLAAVIGPSLFYSMAYMHVYRFLHPWIESSIWIFKNIPKNSMILKEAWDDGLPTGVDHQMDPRVEGSMGPQDYRQKDITIYELHGYPTDDTDIKKNYYADILPTGDYISIASKKLWYTLTDCTPEFRPHGFNVYPVTSRYYRCLWSGLLGYKMVGEFHNFPGLFGWEHPDDMAEESFSVYDHPRVYIFKKIEDVPRERILKLLSSDDYVKGINRDLMRTITPANVDAFIAERHKYLEDQGLLKSLEEAAPAALATPVVTAAKPPPAKPRPPKTASTRALTAPTPAVPAPETKIDAPATVPGLPGARTLDVLQGYAAHPVIEDDLSKIPLAPEERASYQWWAWAIWLLFLILLGVLALPLTLKILGPMGVGAYSLSKILGFFVFAWVVWFFTSLKLCHFTMASCWAWFFLLAALSLFHFWRNQKFYKSAYLKWGHSWLIQEAAFISAFAAFTLVKIYIPHIHDPVGEGYNGGGEAGMDFGFLASVVRGNTFPPENMWMAGLPIGYTSYYGHLMMGILTKTLGLVPAVTYNLGLITLFATIFSGAFGIAYALSGRLSSGWIAGFLCAVAGNPAGAKQYLEAIHQCFTSMSLSPLTNHVYDFFGPTRVIPPLSINEFPYFSVLYGDLHAHTLAMPFGMLLIACLASLFMSLGPASLSWKRDLPVLAFVGFLLGGIAYLNAWEIPTWIVLSALTLAVRLLSGLNGKVLKTSLTRLFITLIASLTLLGVWTAVKPGAIPHALGGGTPLFLSFGILGFLAGGLWLFFKKPTKMVSLRLVHVAVGMAVLLVSAGILWSPYFFKEFHPQQSTILWVLPSIRTSIRNYFNVYGAFLVVLLMSFLAVYSKSLLGWIGKGGGKKPRGFSPLDRLSGVLEKIIDPTNAVQGMISLGLASLAVLWGASWVQWTEPQDKMLYSQLIGTAAAGLFLTAIYFKSRLELWLASMTVGLLWVSVLVLQVIHLIRDMPFTLELGLFSILWLLGFFHVGMAVKVHQNRGQSFAYVLTAFFFFLTAALEIFAISEYFGFGDGMRNNSLFKYGINAWTLASIGAGVFLPQILDFIKNLLRAGQKETPVARRVMLVFSALALFVMLWALMEIFLPYMETPLISIIDIVLVSVLLAWGLLEGWFKKGIQKRVFVSVSVIFILLSVAAALPQGYGRIMGLFQRWGSLWDAEFIFPAGLACVAVGLGALMMEGGKNTGRKMAALGWLALAGMVALMVSIYPYAATIRKCHGFLNVFRRQWGGFVESPTLNGLSFLRRANQADDAAIRFLNDHIPGQPCLLEFVGAGYNTWGSRFSIFTGIPALMGWDGHVNEWVGARLGEDIRNRTSAVEEIFRTTDPALAKRMLDAYGVRLVMVGTVERHGAAEKPGYPAEGLAKFQGFLPLIYKNPEVEIYYNPPPTGGKS